MRKEFIEVDARDEAEERAPWACVIIEVEGGYMAFGNAEDARIWEQQI